ncbi:hypothetical protein [Flavobacterium taihuense]|uniref:Uncharacterized protein n=1 Tax=Flavobacterium taihuense TaxID=2857508 RepID=A0ABS6Y0M6_9FLAO|nr:hypothetical protein [Flavobacterium taihuense]MBW4362487.1 hypothetical protein [Flavobacterium taihuense]
MNIEYIGRDAIIDTPDVAFTYQVSETPRDFYKFKTDNNNLDWNSQCSFIGDYLVHPFGANNDLPDIIKQTVQTNYIAPGILKKKTQLIWGMGPVLYKEKLVETGEGNKRIRVIQEDAQIDAWLESWDYQEYLLKAVTDYQHIEGVFSKYELTKGSRVGSPFIAKLVHQYCDRTRLATEKNNKIRKATHAITSDWSFSNVQALTEFKVYPLFDFLNPFANLNAVLYSNMYSFCTDYYTVPDLYGSLEWLNRSTAVPLIFKALSKNSINLKYHIVSPQAFWDKKQKEIESSCVQKGQIYKPSMLLEYQKQFLEKISVVLSGDENTGKYLHTTKSFTVEGTNLIDHGWEIKVIDQNIKDFVAAQISISERADHALSAGLNLHSALGNVSESGKSDSGSEQIYALKTFLQTGIDIPELIIMKAINYALKVNFPNKGLKLGFYHEKPEKEEAVTPKDRIINK